MGPKVEIWKDVVGFEGLYKVSNQGRIKSLGIKGKGRSLTDVIKICRRPKQKHRYCTTTLHLNNKRKSAQIHRIVAIAFIPNPENKLYVNHINCIKWDNRVENLEWVTASENMKHALSAGILNIMKGSKCGQSKLTELQVIEIKNKLKNKETGVQIAKEFKISEANIRNIKHGRTWKHV